MKTNSSMLHSKPFILVPLLTALLTSCYSYKNLTRNPVTRDVLLKLQPGKDYRFELKTGLKYKVYVDSIESETIGGYIYQKNAQGKVDKMRYSSTFENVETYVTKISVRKNDPVKTIFLLAIPFVLVAYWDSLRFMFSGG